jgi:hypothetical protein
MRSKLLRALLQEALLRWSVSQAETDVLLQEELLRHLLRQLRTFMWLRCRAGLRMQLNITRMTNV